MQNIILPTQHSESWFTEETRALLRATLSPLDTSQADAPIALQAAAHANSLVRHEPVLQVVLSGTTGGLPPDPHRLVRIMDAGESLKPSLALAAIALQSDPNFSVMLHASKTMRGNADAWLDVYITQEAILLINVMGEWDQVVDNQSIFSEQALRRSALCLLPKPVSAHQALEQHHAVRGLGALAEMDVAISPASDGQPRRLCDPILRSENAT
jgi:hypothetical protein